MADFGYVNIRYYTGGPGTITDFGLDVNISGTLTDNDSGSSHFETTDTNMGDGGFLGGGAYLGSINVGGVTVYVIDGGTGDYYLYYDTIPPSWPPTIDLTTDLNTSPALVCFAAGSLIETPEGETQVELLKAGDLVVTAKGKCVPVKWIGHQTVMTRFGPAERLRLVRFAAGSLGDGLPTADLTVTADHGMLLDGVICHAGALVNGSTITRVPLADMGETYTVYHIETEAHEIILANGAPSETFIDNVSRRVFDNYAEFEALYGDVPEMEELPFPRAMSARQVPEWIRTRLSPACAA
jgi:hypothetical protein